MRFGILQSATDSNANTAVTFYILFLCSSNNNLLLIHFVVVRSFAIQANSERPVRLQTQSMFCDWNTFCLFQHHFAYQLHSVDSLMVLIDVKSSRHTFAALHKFFHNLFRCVTNCRYFIILQNMNEKKKWKLKQPWRHQASPQTVCQIYSHRWTHMHRVIVWCTKQIYICHLACNVLESSPINWNKTDSIHETDAYEMKNWDGIQRRQKS